MILRKAASPSSLLQVPYPSPEASPAPSIFSAPSVASWDDDNMSISTEHQAPSRPVSAGLTRIPTLREILANQSSPPYTLSAFTAYLSQRHSLENLEFTMDAKQYAQKYSELCKETTEMPSPSLLEERRALSSSWQRLMNAYIRHGSRKEVNLPDRIHRSLAQSLETHSESDAPPSPEHLVQAVDHIYKLMDESIMMGFISEMAPRSVTNVYSPYHVHSQSSSDLGTVTHDSDEEKKSRHHTRLQFTSQSRNRSRSRHKHSPEPGSGSGSETSLVGPSSSAQPARLSTGITSAVLTATASRRSVGSGTSGDVVMEESASGPSSPSDVMTPPTTPPAGEIGTGGSPRSRANENPLRKMMGRIGGKKKPISRGDR